MSNKRGTMSKPWRKSTPPSVGDIPRRKHEQMVTLTAYQALEKQVKELKEAISEKNVLHADTEKVMIALSKDKWTKLLNDD